MLTRFVVLLLALALLVGCSGGGGGVTSSGTTSTGNSNGGGPSGGPPAGASDRASESARTAALVAGLARLGAQAFGGSGSMSLRADAAPDQNCPVVQFTGDSMGGSFTITGGCTSADGTTYQGTILMTFSREGQGGSCSTSFQGWSVTDPAGVTRTVDGTSTYSMTMTDQNTFSGNCTVDLTIEQPGEVLTISSSTSSVVDLGGGSPTITLNGSATVTSSLEGTSSISFTDVVMQPHSCNCPVSGTMVLVKDGVTATVVFTGCAQAQVTVGDQTGTVDVQCQPPEFVGG